MNLDNVSILTWIAFIVLVIVLIALLFSYKNRTWVKCQYKSGKSWLLALLIYFGGLVVIGVAMQLDTSRSFSSICLVETSNPTMKAFLNATRGENYLVLTTNKDTHPKQHEEQVN